jgi:hypothetical protein
MRAATRVNFEVGSGRHWGIDARLARLYPDSLLW